MAKNIRGLSLIKRTVTGKQLYYFNNAHGDVTTLLAPSGAISGKYYYDAFGNLVEEVDGEGNPYKYAGYEHDDETGLYYLRARYYSPKSARFMSEDSFRGDRTDPLSLNLYTYCRNEPICYIDPTGHAYAHLQDGVDEGSYYNYVGYQNLYKELEQAETPQEKADATKKLEYYQVAISAGDKVTTNEAVKDNIERLEERAYGPSKSSAAGTAKSTNEVERPKVTPTQGTGNGGSNTSGDYTLKDFLKQADRSARRAPFIIIAAAGINYLTLEAENKLAQIKVKNASSEFELPKTVKSPKGVEGEFSVKGYKYRIDTNKVAPGEGGFHVHIFRDGDEIAKLNGRGGYVPSHGGNKLLKPSEINKTVRSEINKLIDYIKKTLK